MNNSIYEMFMYLASYSPWGESEIYPTRLFNAFANDLIPQKYDDQDPPRRVYKGNNSDIQFWFNKENTDWGRWLHFQHTSYHHEFEAVVDCVNRTLEPMKSRGDYNSMYLTVKTNKPEQVIDFWYLACQALHPFHAFLDRETIYNRRAHTVLSDGSIHKNGGWYSHRLPGFFAYNYFGDVYLRHWRSEVPRLPTSLTIESDYGLFVTAPSGLDFGGKEQVHSSDDRDIIQTLGPEWFHLPTQADRSVAPSYEEFLAATPKTL